MKTMFALLRRLLLLLLLVFLLTTHLFANAEGALALMPPEVASRHFVVSVNGNSTPVLLAARGYYLLNFELAAPAEITVVASDPHFWDRGVEVQPMRLGIRPERDRATLHFRLSEPAKVSITRPGEHFGDSEMLFLFANKPTSDSATAQTRGVRYFGPGIHRQNIDAHTGDRIYLAAGSVVFGSINLWQVHNVHIYGEGTLIYEGPQNPDHDEGWMHKPNWHAIVMDNAHDITIEGITTIIRSRTWMVQMRDSGHVVFRNVKIIGGSQGNANQDGMDWLGGGDTLVDDCFIRAADDIFALYGNWDGYDEAALTTPGHTVSNIVIQNSVLSTSISNVVRVGWPRKVFDSHNFTLKDSDVLHMGSGGCGVPFALFELWADPGGKGTHTGFRFEDIRLEDWYALTQILQPNPSVTDVRFSRIWAMDAPGMVASALKGAVGSIRFSSVDLGAGLVQDDRELPITVAAGAAEPSYAPTSQTADFRYTAGLIQPGEDVIFEASATGQSDSHFRWIFGDGTTAEGQTVHHAFRDSEGTLLDGSGRFRVLLSVTDHKGVQTWVSQSIVVANALHPGGSQSPTEPLTTPVYPSAENIDASAPPPTRPKERTIYGADLSVPVDGGYTFTLLTSTTASLVLDGQRAESTTLRPQVCGSIGNAVAPIRLSLALGRGVHHLHIETGSEMENAATDTNDGANQSHWPLLLWEGPGMRRQRVPDTALQHESKSVAPSVPSRAESVQVRP